MLALTLLYPRDGLGYVRHRFRLWACLPGDAFMDWPADITLIVRDVKPGAVTFYAFANEMLDHPDRHGHYGRRPILALERRDRAGLALFPADVDLAQRARGLLA